MEAGAAFPKDAVGPLCYYSESASAGPVTCAVNDLRRLHLDGVEFHFHVGEKWLLFPICSQ